MQVCGDFKRRRQHSATTMHRALPVCEGPALDMPWVTARPNAASAALQCAARVAELALGTAAGPDGWFVGVAVLPVYGDTSD